MGKDLMFGGQPDERHGALTRRSGVQREIERRAERTGAELMYQAGKQEFTAMLRKRRAEQGMHDIADVGNLARELADGDPFLGSLLVPVVEEFARQTAYDVRALGRGY
ncbi:hypothetical protein ABH920_005701 [Catenulispora sp. EB89]|uniref:hypothetical protein n=1 Tax=Catenulispora sp. EB89 TaxID=3156257 RepID=UPI003514D6CF